jgi:hypothetical protein
VAYGARLESVLGASPRGFESPILRQRDQHKRPVVLTRTSPALIVQSLYEAGGRGQDANFAVSWVAARRMGALLSGMSGPGGAPAAAQRRGRRPGRARNRRHDESAGEPERARVSGGGRASGRGAALISLSPPQGARTRWDGRGFAPVAQLIRGPSTGARDYAAPAGAKGLLVVSMCQIASASRRARSTWATLGPRWRPSRVLVRR